MFRLRIGIRKRASSISSHQPMASDSQEMGERLHWEAAPRCQRALLAPQDGGDLHVAPITTTSGWDVASS